jgi:hypothetical protein
MAQMNLLGNRFVKISAVRNPDFSGQPSAKTNIKILDLEIFGKDKNSFKVKYFFEIDYSELGNVTIEGSLFISTDAKTLKELQKSWKEKKIDTSEYIFITNLVIQRASLKALELEEEMGLPIHIKLPKIDLKEK